MTFSTKVLNIGNGSERQRRVFGYPSLNGACRFVKKFLLFAYSCTRLAPLEVCLIVLILQTVLNFSYHQTVLSSPLVHKQQHISHHHLFNVKFDTQQMQHAQLQATPSNYVVEHIRHCHASIVCRGFLFNSCNWLMMIRRCVEEKLCLL